MFRITQTEEKLRGKGIIGKENACNAHYEVGLKVRQTMNEPSGIMPENLPVAEKVKKIAVPRKARSSCGATSISSSLNSRLGQSGIIDPLNFC